MSLRKHKKELLGDFQEHVIRMFAKDEQGIDHLEEIDPWNEDYCFLEIRLEEQTIVDAFVSGIIRAQRWDGDLFQCPQNMTEVLTDIARSVQFLRFGSKDGKIRMSINELIDKHMRNWIANSSIMTEWIAKNILTSRAVLRNACRNLIMRQQAFDYHYQKMLKKAKRHLSERFADIRNESGESGDFPATTSSQLLSAVEITPAKPVKKQSEYPSGLQPSV